MPAPVERDIGGRHFVIGRIPPVEQFHLMSKFAPVIEALNELRERELKTSEDVDDARASIVIMAAFGRMPDADRVDVLNRSLARVRMQNGPNNTWANVWQNGQLMFEEEIPYPTLLRLVMTSVQENLGSFSDAPPPPSGSESQAA